MRETEAAAAERRAAQAVAMHTPPGEPAAIDVSTRELHDLAFRHGECYDSYLATEPGRTAFWLRDREGVVTYVRRGRNLLAGGGLLTTPERKEQLLRDFIDMASGEGRRAVFHNICDHDLHLFRKLGFEVTKWGEEPIIDLDTCRWAGKSYEWVRRQSNYCLRQGLTAFEVGPETLTAQQWSRTLSELLEVSAESLQKKPQNREMRFYVGQLADHPLGLRRLFVARGDNGAGRIEGFVVCNPMRSGTQWAAEIFRHRQDGVRGTIPFLLHQTARQLQAEGVRGMSLCLIPGLRCSTPLEGDSFLIRRGLSLMEHGFGWVYDIAGMRHFKSRFRPRYEDRYLCSLPGISVGSICAMLGAFGGLRLSVSQVVRIAFERLRKRNTRATLAQL
jgi:phosphatidylglycerol lysyltransferase